ncbi:alpha/beta hydrolase [Solirubrobacter ginsenosidimutans]|uniref:Alpha/beta hydrolase n=1 Tax=Solirubrobacter ginsenosidimutans TaxID=490573 RepID=A0A9X3MZ95_9ACTN|nr:alpha/beta hydrolase [Solirubrobacter ginsenosidimutans]MDA0164381.1 alpha/beta hydrolase [Solirubrobacter ginsenosidimutans]
MNAPEASESSEPFRDAVEVAVTGGMLRVARAGSPPEEAQGVVLALHGMTGTHMVYRTVARELSRNAPELCLLAPDLRGRGASAGLPAPYGMGVHVADLIAVLDDAAVERAVVVGHSMGCNVAARLAAEHPERVAAVVLLDGGLPLLPDNMMSEDDEQEDESHEIFARFESTYATVDAYMGYWRQHPGLERAWDEDVEAFVRRDFKQDRDGVRCRAHLEAVRKDVADIMLDGRTWTAITRVSAPVRVLRAERGFYDDDPVIPLEPLDKFVRDHPHVSVEVVSDVNHFTLVIGGGHGPRRVAATLAAMALGDTAR